MEDETKPPVEVVPQRSHFHLLLGMILVPFVSAGVGWILALNDVLHGYATRMQLAWTRLLVLLVLVDSLVVMGVVWRMSNPEEFKKIAEGPSAPRLRIGVMFETDDRNAAPIVGETLPGYPADQAGLLPGDLIVSVDGSPVTTAADAGGLIGNGEPGVVRHLMVRREDVELAIDVAPVRAPKAGLFQVSPAPKSRGQFPDLRPFLPAVALGGLAWAIGWVRFKDRGVVWVVALSVLAVSEIAAVAAGGILEAAVGGATMGGWLISAGVNSGSLVLLGLLAPRIARDPRLAAAAGPHGSTAGTYFRGLYYLITGGIRVGFLLLLADLIWWGAKGVNNPIEQVVGNTTLGAAGVALLILDTVVLAPIGQELLFRGLLLPRLALQRGAVWGIGASAAVFALLHPHYGLYIPLILLYGAILGWARVRSGGLVAPILLHMSINALSVAVILSR